MAGMRMPALALGLLVALWISLSVLAGCAGQPDSDKHTMTPDDYDDVREMLETFRGAEL